MLKYGDKIQIFDWTYTTPRFVLPVLKKSDIDNDGQDEIMCVLNVNSGTGVAVDELHILELDKTKGYVDYKFSDYLAQVKTKLSYNYDKKLTFKNISYGDIVHFDISNGLKVNIPLGIVFDEFASPEYSGKIMFGGDITF